MKVLFVLFYILILFIFNSLSVFAAPQLEIGYSDFKCHELYNEGFDRCNLTTSVRLSDYSYNSKYDEYTYHIECQSKFTYTTLSKSTGYTWTYSKTGYDSTTLYGTNSYGHIDIRFSPSYSFDPVIRVAPGTLYCRVTNVY